MSVKSPVPTYADLCEAEMQLRSFLKRLIKVPECYRFHYRNALEVLMDERDARWFARRATLDMVRGVKR
jgi:hypothetical protein